MSTSSDPTDLSRYHRQMLLPDFGEPGQRRLGSAHALLVGCGALGSVIADSLVRAGIGRLSIVDRDVVELTNLQRQVLFDERDVADMTPKAEAAAARLARINHQVDLRPHVDDFSHRNAARFLNDDVDCILDGLDNFETRYLLNDLAVSHHLPYLYGGAVGLTGMSMTFLPHPRHGAPRAGAAVQWSEDQSTPCLRCIFPEPPPPGTTATCDTAGVLGPVVSLVGAHQAAQAIKLLTGNIAALDRRLWSVDLGSNTWSQFDVATAASPSCPCCGAGEFPHQGGEAAAAATSLCGRNAVQISAGDADAPGIDLDQMADRLAPHGQFKRNPHLLHGTFRDERSESGDPIALTLFANGRAIIVGTTEPKAARTLYAKYIGG